MSLSLDDWDRDGKPDLIGMKKYGTGSGRTEVRIMSGARNFQRHIRQTPTYPGLTGDNWEFAVKDADMDGHPDLFGIVKSGTASGKTDLYVLSGANNFQGLYRYMPTTLNHTGNEFTFLVR